MQPLWKLVSLQRSGCVATFAENPNNKRMLHLGATQQILYYSLKMNIFTLFQNFSYSKLNAPSGCNSTNTTLWKWTYFHPAKPLQNTMWGRLEKLHILFSNFKEFWDLKIHVFWNSRKFKFWMISFDFPFDLGKMRELRPLVHIYLFFNFKSTRHTNSNSPQCCLWWGWLTRKIRTVEFFCRQLLWIWSIWNYKAQMELAMVMTRVQLKKAAYLYFFAYLCWS